MALLAVGDGPQVKNVHPEEHHEKDEVDIEALIRKIAEEEELTSCNDQAGRVGGTVAASRRTLNRATPIGRLTEVKNNNGDMSSALAFDDVSGMKLEA